MQKKMSIKSRVIGLLLFCWLLPLLLLVAFNFYYINSSHFDNKISKQKEQLKYSNLASAERLKEVIRLSRAMSYDEVIVPEYEHYEREEITGHKLLATGSSYLIEKYRHEESVQAAVLWFKENPKKLHCSTYNESVNGIYPQVHTYWEKDHRAIEHYVNTLDTTAGFYRNKDRLYLVRNVKDDTYRDVAVLVLLVNQSYCFEPYAAFSPDSSITLLLEDCKIQVMGEEVSEKETGLLEMGGSAGYRWENGMLWLYRQMSAEDFYMKTLVRFDDSSAFSPFYGYREILIGMTICLIPLLLVLLRVFSRHITKPMNAMLRGAAEIEEGNLGYQLEYEPESTEFYYLAESFNKMSKRLKYQFDHIYEEELALRDARIMALQSHLNPHFMNNTLEIINWEARLSGNEKVSQMIESLATLMDAGIDRKRQREVTLSEEMVSVNAYLYIISMRFGDRLMIIQNLPEEIMQYKVPRLILQPVIENAVEHGVASAGSGTITLSGFHEGAYLYLDIVNEGHLSKEDREKIKRLLDVDYDTSRESSGNMGIANVNQRLRILYGDSCGLILEQIDEKRVRARLKILLEKDGKNVQQITD